MQAPPGRGAPCAGSRSCSATRRARTSPPSRGASPSSRPALEIILICYAEVGLDKSRVPSAGPSYSTRVPPSLPQTHVPLVLCCALGVVQRALLPQQHSGRVALLLLRGAAAGAMGARVSGRPGERWVAGRAGVSGTRNALHPGTRHTAACGAPPRRTFSSFFFCSSSLCTSFSSFSRALVCASLSAGSHRGAAPRRFVAPLLVQLSTSAQLLVLCPHTGRKEPGTGEPRSAALQPGEQKVPITGPTLVLVVVLGPVPGRNQSLQLVRHLLVA